MQLSTALVRYMDANSPLWRPATIDNLIEAAKRWTQALGAEARLRDLSAGRLRQYLIGRLKTCAATTVTLDLHLLRAFFSWCVREGLLESSPAGSLRGPRLPQRPIRVMDHHEQSRILHVASGIGGAALEVLIVLAIETGLRQRTLLSLQWSHVDLEQGWLNIPGQYLKSGRQLRIPLSESALAILREWGGKQLREGHLFPWERKRCGEKWLQACRRAGVKGLRFHDLRKTFLTRCRERGVQMEVAMALSDHQDLRTVLRCYRAVSDDDLLRGVGRLKALAQDGL